VTERLIFLFSVFVIAVDDIHLHEVLWSSATMHASVLDRLKSLRKKLRSLRRGTPR
jgi:hypothetical protein